MGFPISLGSKVKSNPVDQEEGCVGSELYSHLVGRWWMQRHVWDLHSLACTEQPLHSAANLHCLTATLVLTRVMKAGNAQLSSSSPVRRPTEQKAMRTHTVLQRLPLRRTPSATRSA